MKIDIGTLKLLSVICFIFSRFYKDKINSIVELLQYSLDSELNLLKEASIGSQLKKI